MMTRRNSAAVLTMTVLWNPKVDSMVVSTMSTNAGESAFESTTTFPLWRRVFGSSRPTADSAALSSAILIRLFPPTLIPRSNTTYLAMPSKVVARRDRTTT